MITMEDVINNPIILHTSFKTLWNFDLLSENPNFTYETIKNYPYFPWNYDKINSHIHIRPEFYRKLKNKFQSELINELKLFPGEPRFPIAPPLAFG